MRARPLVAVSLGVLVGAVAVVSAWLLDSRAHRRSVLPRVVLAGHGVRGMDTAELSALVQKTADAFTATSVRVETRDGRGGFEATVPDLGVQVDRQRTVAEVMAVGRRGAAPRRLWRWMSSFVSPVRVPFAIQIDGPKLNKVVAARDQGRVHPTEPSLEVVNGRLQGVPGKDGRGVDPAELATTLRRTVPTPGTIVVTMTARSIPPRFSKSDADRLAAQAEQLLGSGIPVAVGERTETIPVESLRGWLDAAAGEEALELAVRDDAAVTDGLAEMFPDAGTAPVDAGLSVSGGRVVVTPSKPGTACCGDDSRRLIVEAVLDPAKRASPVQLPLRSVPASRDEEAVRKLGIVEQVATFTTSHSPGEPRVQNIQLMADTVRGTIIPPGGTFSINGTVGQRTKAKGYVEAPIISGDYKFEADVGGGVSQFATTMFNAAFFAGLDITEYYMHGLYISRYPYGREATLSFPGPDLKVRNTTPYGVLVWPTYTSTSITVSLYSTKHLASSEQTGQTREEREARPPPNSPPDAPRPGPCVTVTTERTRVYLDGRSVVDRFSGTYAPAEGWSCPSRG